ncbi:hypothetical protein [Nevskia soli]|uniref:hypothetical protein n=1 Tax=Nevskia soli TaxID=418856 RepID=UPI0015D77996|nr:hypothetical protein [Nevskia soli]
MTFIRRSVLSLAAMVLFSSNVVAQNSQAWNTPETTAPATFLSPANFDVTTTPGQIFNSTGAQLIAWKSSGASKQAEFNLSGFPCSALSCGAMSAAAGRLYDWTPLASSASGLVGNIIAVGAGSPNSGSTVPFALLSVLPLTPAGGPSLPVNCPNAAASAVAGAACLSLVPETAVCGTECLASGFADPSIRRDPLLPGTGLWLAYSFGESCSPTGPTCGTGTTPAIAIHLVASHDGGATWGPATTLYEPSYVPIDSPSCEDRSRNSGNAYTSNEVMNLAPDGTGNWYGVHQQYCVQANGTILYGTLYPYTNALILAKAATSPVNLQTPVLSARFGNADLSAMAGIPLESCMSFDEPALLIHDSLIYLFVECLPPPNSTSPPQYYTLVAPTDSDWTLISSWSEFGPPFGGPADANRYDEGSLFLTEFDIAERPDGTFIAVVTPATGLDPETHLGCLAIAFTLPTFSGTIDNYFGTTYAEVNDDAGSASHLGNSGCTFDPASATGLIIPRKVRSAGGIVTSLLETGLMP